MARTSMPNPRALRGPLSREPRGAMGFINPLHSTPRHVAQARRRARMGGVLDALGALSWMQELFR